MNNSFVGFALLGVIGAVAVMPAPTIDSTTQDPVASVATDQTDAAVGVPPALDGQAARIASTTPCPQGVFVNGDAVGDGCPAAGQTGSYRQASFFSTAPQSGQRYTVRPGWNVAGVDYPIGYDTTLPLKDPATAVLPTGCTYLPGGRSGIAGFPTVDCAGAPGFTLNGWDFSGASSIGPAAGGIMLMLEASLGGTCAITNNRFAYGPNHHNNAYGPPALIFATSSTVGCSVDLEHNDFTGGWPTYSDDQSMIVNNFASNAIYEYNAFHDAPGRALTTGGKGCPSLTWRYNMVANVGMVPYSDNHGEEWANFVGANCPIDHLFSDFNTLLISTATGPVQGGAVQSVTNYGTLAALTFTSSTNLAAGNTIQVSGILPAAFDGTFTVTRVSGRNVYYNYAGGTFQSGAAATVKTAGQWTAPFFLSSGAGLNTTVNAATVNNNTGSGNGFNGETRWAQVQSAIVNIGYAAINNLEIKDNYIDCTGSWWAMFNQAQIDTGVQGSISGYSITLTGAAGTGAAIAIPGSWLYGQGITPTQIQPYGTSGSTAQGLLGTYAGSVSQTVSFTRGALNTAIGAQTISGNTNLVTGNPVTAAGFDMRAGVCEGHS